MRKYSNLVGRFVIVDARYDGASSSLSFSLLDPNFDVWQNNTIYTYVYCTYIARDIGYESNWIDAFGSGC